MPLSNFQMPDYLTLSQPGALGGVVPSQVNIPGLSVAPNPTLNGSEGWFGIDGLGKNMETLKGGVAGLQTLAGLWSSLKALDLAKKQLSFTKATTNANLANQTQSYNTGIADRARARGAFEGQSSSQVSDYIAQNSLAKRTV